MQVALRWTGALLTGALLAGACSKAPAPEAAPTAPAVKAEPPSEQAAAPAPAPEPAAAAEPPTAAAPAPDDGTPPEFKLGQSRDEVMERFGTCAVRRVFLPAGPGSLYVEIYQPKNDEACIKRLGERQFTIRGGTLYQMTPGLIPPEPPHHEKPEGT